MRMSKELQEWSERHFGAIELGDCRRVKRVKTIASAFASRPGASIPRSFETPYDVKAAYNLFHHPEATPENLQAGHRSLVQRFLKEPVTTLLLEDTSEFAWNTGRPIDGLGPVGKGRAWDKGFLLHSVLAVRWNGEGEAPGKRPPLDVLGIVDQQYYVRKPIPEGEDGNDSWARMHRARESRLWVDSGQHIGRPPEGCTWVRVCDRGADITSFSPLASSSAKALSYEHPRIAAWLAAAGYSKRRGLYLPRAVSRSSGADATNILPGPRIYWSQVLR